MESRYDPKWWNRWWSSYRGPVKVVMDDTSERVGKAIDARPKDPLMCVRFESGEEAWVNPRYVWPLVNRVMASWGWRIDDGEVA